MLKRIVNLFIIISMLIMFCPLTKNEVNAASSKSVNILFIGNSKTYYNNMPKMLNNMLTTSGKKNVYKVLVKGSHSLNFHYNYIRDHKNKIKNLFNDKIDYVILNEQTDVQLTNYGKTYDSNKDPDLTKRYPDKRVYGNLSKDAINILNQLYKYKMITKSSNNNTGTRIILNATWNYKDLNDTQLSKSNSNFQKTRNAIRNAGYKNCYIAYTGNAIKAVNKEMNKTKNRSLSKQKLFVDERHTTEVGSYIEALTLYKAMIQKKMTADYGGRITKNGMNNSKDNYVDIVNYKYLKFYYTNKTDYLKRAFNKVQVNNVKDYKKIRNFINSKIISYT